MYIFPTCPVELTDTVLSADNNAELTFLNLSASRIAGLELIARWQDGTRTAVCPVRLNGLRARSREYFHVKLCCPALPETDAVSIGIARVIFDDTAADWRADNAPKLDPDAMGTAEAKAYWRCGCGRYNVAGTKRCMRCDPVTTPAPAAPTTAVRPSKSAAFPMPHPVTVITEPVTKARTRFGLFRALRVITTGTR